MAYDRSRSRPKGYPTKRSAYAVPQEYRYPLNTKKRVRAAIAYFSRPAYARRYTKSEQLTIWKRMVRAAKRYKIDLSRDAGPPSVMGKWGWRPGRR